MESWHQVLAALADGRLAALKRHAFLLCGDEPTAEDLVQEALVRAFSRPLHKPPPATAEAYVRKVMVNLFIDQARRQARWVKAAPVLARSGPEPDIAEGVAVRGALLTAMEGLSPRQRACVVLRFYEDLPVAEVARVLGVQMGTASRHLSDAMARLGELMADTETR